MGEKPLGGKAYGSIPHLPGSRVGPGDYHSQEGQALICTEKARDKFDLIIVQEKLDGSNLAVWRVERQDRVDFLAKYVRPDKVDGYYLPEISGKEAVWNWREV